MSVIARRVGAALALFAAAGLAAAAESGPFVFPAYRSAAEIHGRCDTLLGELERRRAALSQNRASDGLLEALDELTLASDQTLGPISFIAEVHPSKAVRDAAEVCRVAPEPFRGGCCRTRRSTGGCRRSRPPTRSTPARARNGWRCSRTPGWRSSRRSEPGPAH